MAPKKVDLYIFHINRKEGDPLLLHPFEGPDQLVAALEGSEIHGRYGQEPRVETLTLLKNELYRMVETGVQRWISDKRFTPRFLISAGVFVFAYFFLSYVIRDPVPLIDELAISLAASVVTYFLLGRRDLRSDVAAKKRVSLRGAVDQVVFNESAFAKMIEETLQERESGTLEDLVGSLLSPGDRAVLDGEDHDEARCFVETIEARFGLRSTRREERLFKRYLQGEKPDLEGIKRWAQSRKIDVALYAVYRKLKRTVAADPRH